MAGTHQAVDATTLCKPYNRKTMSKGFNYCQAKPLKAGRDTENISLGKLLCRLQGQAMEMDLGAVGYGNRFAES